jgi:hypothetical protein
MNVIHPIKTEHNKDEQHILATKKHHSIFIRIYNAEDEAVSTIFTNQPGHFPKKLSRGNQYIMVLCNNDSNVILVTAMKNCSSGKMIRAYQQLIDRLHSTGIRPKQHILDNECSEDFKQTICKNQMTF